MKGKVISQNDKEYLLKSLEALRNLVFYLSKDALFHSDEVLIRLWHQTLGNCLKKLNLNFITSSLELKDSIFWTGANKERIHFYNRMDTAHELKFSSFINPLPVSFKEMLLQECQTLISIIKSELPEALAESTQAMMDDASFDLRVEVLLQAGRDNSPEGYIRNIWQALEIAQAIDINRYTLSNIAIILIANQIIGNNFNKLPAQYRDMLDGLLVDKMICNRNNVAHTTEFDSIVGQQSYLCSQYFVPFETLREGIRPLAEPLMRLTAARAAAEPHSMAEELEQDESAAVERTFYEAHSGLFKQLKQCGIIEQAKKLPKQKGNGRIFSDEDLWHILVYLITKNNIKLYREILNNLEHYTETKAREFINTPILYTKSPGVVEVTDPAPNTTYLRYIADNNSQYFKPIRLNSSCDTDQFLARKELYPSMHYTYLLEISLVYRNFKENEFLMTLLGMGVDIDIVSITSKRGEQPVLFAVMRNNPDILPLLAHYGANLDICDEEGYMLLHGVMTCGLQWAKKAVLIEKLLNCGANPCKFLDLKGGYKGNLLSSVVGHPLCADDEGASMSKILINFMAYKYGFDPIKAMLKNAIKVKNYWVAQCYEDGKTRILKLFNMLEGLNKSVGDTELFKVILSNNIGHIQRYLEEKTSEEINRLSRVQIECAMIEDAVIPINKKKITLAAFAGMFCTQEVKDALFKLIINAVKQSRVSKATDDSKQGDHVPPVNLRLQILSPTAPQLLAVVPPEPGQVGSSVFQESTSSLQHTLPESAAIQHNGGSFGEVSPGDSKQQDEARALALSLAPVIPPESGQIASSVFQESTSSLQHTLPASAAVQHSGALEAISNQRNRVSVCKRYCESCVML